MAKSKKVEIDEDTAMRLRRCREGISRARCWVTGYEAGGGRFMWGDGLIDAQVIINRIIAQLEK